ncbi:antibacterial peptide PMAP-23-like [Sarcophilus harrisii]
MASFKIVLPLLLLSLIEVKASNDQEGLTYIDALTIAVTYVNENSEDKNAYWLNGHELQPQWNNTSREPHYLSFIVKETNCLTTQTLTPIACAFKENGKEKYCQGVIVAINEKEANVWAKCVPVGSTEIFTKNDLQKSEKQDPKKE